MKKKSKICGFEKTVSRLMSEIIYHICISNKPSENDEISTYVRILRRSKMKTPKEVDATIFEAVRRIDILFPTTITSSNKGYVLLNVARARKLILDDNEEN